jgi:hypothetical protein
MKPAVHVLLALSMFVAGRADSGDDHTVTEITAIEAALCSLKRANAGDNQRRAAVAEFEQAFGKLKQELAARPSAEAVRALRGRLNDKNTHWGNLEVPIPIDGRVLQVDPRKKQVLLSTGSKDGIRNGQLYRVYQSGKLSPDQTGWIRITRVESQWSTAAILHEYSPRAAMKPNDIIQRNDGEEPRELKHRSRESRRIPAEPDAPADGGHGDGS